MSDESVVAAVSAANAKAHIEHITTQIPSRLAGSANGKRMAEYSAAALTKAGVSARGARDAGAGELSREGGDAGAGARRAVDRGQHAGPQPADAPRRHLGRADGRGLRRLQRVRGPRRHRQDHALGALLPSRAPREAAHLRHHGRDRVRDDELGAPGEHGGAVRLGQAGVGQPDARDLQNRDGDAALHRHRPHRRPEAARDAEGRAGARVVPRQRRERLASRADHGRRGQGPTDDFVVVGGHQDSWPGPAGHRQRRRQCLHPGACPRLPAAPRQAAPRPRRAASGPGTRPAP